MQINKLLGDGTFGRVLECEDIVNNNVYAMKIIKPVRRYIKSAKIECSIMEDVGKKDIHNKSHCINVIEGFSFISNGKEYYAMLFQELGLSLYDFLKFNNYRGYSMSQIQSFAKQIFEGICTLHKIGIIHTDLKPENIVLINSNYKEIRNFDTWPINVKAKERIQPVLPNDCYSKNNPNIYNMITNTEIKIIDFGGAIYFTDNCTGIINTRQYRGPEVILNAGKWDEKTDVWSIACILEELYTGELLFDTHEDEEHLCLIEKVCGMFPNSLIERCENDLYEIFEKKNYEDDYSYCIDIKFIERHYKIKDALKRQNLIHQLIEKEHKEFADFLEFLLILDPNKRPSCEEALKHPFFGKKFID